MLYPKRDAGTTYSERQALPTRRLAWWKSGRGRSPFQRGREAGVPGWDTHPHSLSRRAPNPFWLTRRGMKVYCISARCHVVEMTCVTFSANPYLASLLSTAALTLSTPSSSTIMMLEYYGRGSLDLLVDMHLPVRCEIL